MADFWTGDPAYLEYTDARWRRDTVRAAELVRVGLADRDPLVRAHWLVAQASMLMDVRTLPGNLERAWGCLDEALSSASDLYELRRHIFMVLFGIVTYEGTGQRLRSILRRLQPDLRRFIREPGICFNIGVTRFYAGYWRQARLWLDRAFAGGFVNSGGAAGQAVAIASRARVDARLGRLREAEAGIAEACTLFDRYGQGRPRHGGLTLAEAEVALMVGRLQTARAVIQQHLAEANAKAPINLLQFYTLAAELALAEGNHAGYQHYGRLALAVCHEHGLKLPVRFVQTVMAEAERRYGAPTRR